jgi:hypothetical protein
VGTALTAHEDQLELEALARLSRVQGPGELHAAILALITPADSVGSFVAWTAETQRCATAAVLRGEITQITDATRLPCFERLLERMRALPKEDRRALLESTRRVVAAFSPLRPIDRLHWLFMRRKLGERPPVAALPEVHNDLRSLPRHTAERVACVAAYLSRMVPGPERDAGRIWYATAMTHLIDPRTVPPCRPPDGDGLARALLDVEALPWMLRPVLLRAWVDSALAISQRARLWSGAADALRLLAGLLESPLPPELARHYREVEWGPRH